MNASDLLIKYFPISHPYCPLDYLSLDQVRSEYVTVAENYG